MLNKQDSSLLAKKQQLQKLHKFASTQVQF